MKFQPDTLPGVNMIHRHDPGRIVVGASAYGHSLIVPWVGEVLRWDVDRFEALTADQVERLAALKPELVIIGSGLRLRFPAPPVLRPLIDRRVGFETMDTAAACRTYNVLVSEKRSVVAALILESSPG